MEKRQEETSKKNAKHNHEQHSEKGNKRAILQYFKTLSESPSKVLAGVSRVENMEIITEYLLCRNLRRLIPCRRNYKSPKRCGRAAYL